MNAEDIKDWDSGMICAKIRELEKEYDDLQREYMDRKSRIIHDTNLLQTKLSNVNCLNWFNETKPYEQGVRLKEMVDQIHLMQKVLEKGSKYIKT